MQIRQMQNSIISNTSEEFQKKSMESIQICPIYLILHQVIWTFLKTLIQGTLRLFLLFPLQIPLLILFRITILPFLPSTIPPPQFQTLLPIPTISFLIHLSKDCLSKDNPPWKVAIWIYTQVSTSMAIPWQVLIITWMMAFLINWRTISILKATWIWMTEPIRTPTNPTLGKNPILIPWKTAPIMNYPLTSISWRQHWTPQFSNPILTKIYILLHWQWQPLHL